MALWTRGQSFGERIEIATGLLSTGIAKLVASDEWTKYLETQATFFSFSFKNTMLILQQCPQASDVRNYDDWKKAGRHVREGETGIRIWFPRFKRKAEREVPEDEGRPIGWGLGPVFDISQTDGPELPPRQHDVVQLLPGEGGAELIPHLIELAKLEGFSVKFVDLGPVLNGRCNYTRNLIQINKARPLCSQLRTLVHELAHALLHRGLPPAEWDRGDKELEAESVAFVVMNVIGIDAGAYSFGYVAGWAGDKASERVTASAVLIQRTAKLIVQFLQNAVNHLEEAQEEVAA